MINGKQLPAIDVESMYLSIDSSKVDITLSGSILADVADVFINVFKVIILPLVTGIADLIAPSVIVRNVNAIVAQSNGIVALSLLDNLGFDYSYTYIPEVTNSQIDFYVNGTIFNATNGEQSPN